MSTINPAVGAGQPLIPNSGSANQTSTAAFSAGFRKLWLWPAVAIVAALWAFHVAIDYVELSMPHRFLFRFGFYGLVLLAFLVWWLAFSRAAWKEKVVGVAAFVLGTIVAGLLADKKSLGSMGPLGVLLSAFPFVLTLWTVWLVVAQNWLPKWSPAVRCVHLSAVIMLPLFFFDFVRWDGLDGGQHAQFSWRWSKTSEEKFLTARTNPKPDPEKAEVIKPLQAVAGDWTEFRGQERNNQVRGVKLATDWEHHPPKLLWKHLVGPAWSSVIVVDGKLFTQEQRGENEAIVCYNADNGKEIWAHEDSARFEEVLAGAGPRGTPTFFGGRIYALGGTGVLNCLDAATGKPVWTKDITADAESTIEAGSQLRQWGYSNSPLIVGGNVVVFAGGMHDKGLLAYRAEDGELAWKSPVGSDGYSSPQLASIGGVDELLMHTNDGLFAVEPEKGKLLWKQPNNSKMFLPITQPQSVGATKLLTQSAEGVALIEVSHKDDAWEATQKWESNSLKPSLNDYVVLDGNAYGFDDGVFCCIDLETGRRRWKGGRYGHGQVLLLPDQPMLVVVSETGEAVLIAPNSTKLNELARFQMIEGKTWNHPVIAHGKMFVRNAEEMACYEVPLSESK